MKRLDDILGDEFREELIRQNSVFNLKDFYFNNSARFGFDDTIGGLIIISPAQKYCCYSCKHADVFWNLSGEMFNEPLSKLANKMGWNKEWFEYNIALGNIGIQLMVDSPYVLMWVPSIINSYQKKELDKICEELRGLSKFGKELIIQTTYASYDLSENSLVTYPDIQSIDDNIEMIDEFIVGDDYNESLVGVKSRKVKG